jgi:hypothetical protein
VAPSKVRLIPTGNDAYAWRALPGGEVFFSRLFSQNLSDHETSAHKELSEGVGVIFEAVPATNYANAVPNTKPSVRN